MFSDDVLTPLNKSPEEKTKNLDFIPKTVKSTYNWTCINIKRKKPTNRNEYNLNPGCVRYEYCLMKQQKKQRNILKYKPLYDHSH